jgi:lipopolysaccharide cholinephosphotransferase
MTEIQKCILRNFKYIINFLKTRNLRYISAYGTILGAVRHKGFIPWDDDIDIYMPREDYNKLLKYKDKLKTDNHDLVSVETDKGYYLHFAKFTDETTTIWELRHLPFVFGLYIDIFPLDYYDLSDEEIIAIQKKSHKLFYNYQATLVDDNFFNGFKYLFQKRYGTALRAFKKPFFHNTEKQLANYLQYKSQNASNVGEKCVCCPMSIGKIFKRSWFEDVIEVPFEDTTIIIPKDYDEYLTLMYGDWRTPPPLEVQQSSAHADCRYYINLKERLTLEQVKERIKNGEYSVL